MKNIKNIVVATDFSVTARHAYVYAKKLAKALSAALTVVHVKENLMIASDVVILVSVEEDSQITSNIEQLISEEKDGDNELQEINIKILNGEPVKVLTELSKNNDTDLIVIGTTGLSDVLTKIFGSTSLKVSNKAHCPVILVPRDVKWHALEQIMFASNYDSMTSEFVQHITDFVVGLNSNIHFVNVKNFDPLFEAKQKEIDWNKLTANDSALQYEKHTIYGNDTVEQLKNYCEEKNIDLMVFVSKHRDFWENLMHKSITERIALFTTIPIMVMHVDDKQ
ncbi:MAG: universal stress protein [Bacteroidetes bacterium]|nr:universal stress protein [Bacteroidota bacterium]